MYNAERTKSKQPFIIGRQPVIEAIKAGRPMERIFVQRNMTGESVHQLRELATLHRIPMNYVPPEKLNRMSRGNHQGCIGIAALVHYHELQDVISFVVEKGEVPLFLMTDGITDVRNIGALARSALCCGAQAIILPENGVASLNEEAMKSSAGALEHLYVCRDKNLLKAAETLHLNGFQLLAADMNGEKLLHDCDWTVPCAVILGAEDKGIDPVLGKMADITFHIPMAGKFDSFNVSVATGIILYEALKQRMGLIGAKS